MEAADKLTLRFTRQRLWNVEKVSSFFCSLGVIVSVEAEQTCPYIEARVINHWSPPFGVIHFDVIQSYDTLLIVILWSCESLEQSKPSSNIGIRKLSKL